MEEFVEPINARMCFTLSSVLRDSFEISSATTEKPLPCSPALAASMLAFNANKPICLEISVISIIILPISSPAGVSFQYAHSAVPYLLLFLPCLLGFSAGTSVCSLFIIGIVAPGF